MSIYADDAVFEYPGIPACVGIKSILQLMSRIPKMYPGFKLKIKKNGCNIAEGEWAAVEYELEGYFINGSKFKHNGLHIWQIRERKIKYQKVIYDTYQHLKDITPLLGSFPVDTTLKGILFEDED